MNSTNNEILPQGYKMTELGPLPEKWEVVRLGEVAEISSGGSAPQGDEYFKGDKPFIRVSHIDNEDYSIKKYDLINDKAIHDYKLKLFSKGTIVFPKSGATVYLEKRAILPTDAYVVSHLCTVLSNRKDVIQHFLFYVLRSLKLAKEKADGYPTLNISEIKQILLPLPPLPEQQRIAAVLSAVQEAKEKTQAVIDATKALKKSMMKHLFTYGPVSPEETENVPLKETKIGKVPEDWEVVKLEEVGNIITGNTPSKNNKEYWDNGTIDFIKPPDLQNQKIVTFSEKISNSAVRKARIVNKALLSETLEIKNA
jgi:type I restriction enzyme S subunit